MRVAREHLGQLSGHHSDHRRHLNRVKPHRGVAEISHRGQCGEQRSDEERGHQRADQQRRHDAGDSGEDEPGVRLAPLKAQRDEIARDGEERDYRGCAQIEARQLLKRIRPICGKAEGMRNDHCARREHSDQVEMVRLSGRWQAFEGQTAPPLVLGNNRSREEVKAVGEDETIGRNNGAHHLVQ